MKKLTLFIIFFFAISSHLYSLNFSVQPGDTIYQIDGSLSCGGNCPFIGGIEFTIENSHPEYAKVTAFSDASGLIDGAVKLGIEIIISQDTPLGTAIKVTRTAKGVTLRKTYTTTTTYKIIVGSYETISFFNLNDYDEYNDNKISIRDIAIDDERNVIYCLTIGIPSTYYKNYKLFALDRTGTVKWIYDLSDLNSNISRMAVDSDGFVYFVRKTDKAVLFSISPQGELNWQYKFDEYYEFNYQPPSIGLDGSVIVGIDHSYLGSDSLYSFQQDGTLNWKTPVEFIDVDTKISIDGNGNIYFFSHYNMHGKINVYKPDGTLKWIKEVEYKSVLGPIIIGENDNVFHLGNHSGSTYLQWCSLYSLNSNGNIDFETNNNFLDPHHQIIGPGGSIYIASGQNMSNYSKSELSAVNQTDGNEIWSYDLELVNNEKDWIRLAPLVGADSTIYITTNENVLYAIQPNGVLQKSIPVPGRMNAIKMSNDGRIYLYCYDDKVIYTYQTESGGLANTPWPCDGHDSRNTSCAATVIPEPLPPSANFLADSTTGTVPLVVQFFDSSKASVSERLWNFGDDSTSTEKNPVHIYSTPGTYSVTLTVNGIGGSDIMIKQNYIIVEGQSAVNNTTSNVLNEFKLQQNYPNPFNPETTITFRAAKDDHYNLKVYNISGQKVAVLLDDDCQAGTHQVLFDASNLPSGTYFYRLEGGGMNVIKKMILLK